MWPGQKWKNGKKKRKSLDSERGKSRIMGCCAVQTIRQSRPEAFRAKAHCTATLVGFSFCRSSAMKRIQVGVGTHIGRWTVREEAPRSTGKNRNRRFWCQCTCGTERSVQLTHLRQGVSQSCGCLRRERSVRRATTHGLSGTAIYHVFHDMHSRCYNIGHRRYKDWGGRGIAVYREWHDIHVFVSWAKRSGYSPRLTIDRIDNNGDYSPANCRWATMVQQGNNRRISYNGETLTLTEWARRLGLHPVTLSQRLKAWPLEKALTEPLHLECSHPRGNNAFHNICK